MLDSIMTQVLYFLAWFLSLFIPLFLIPQVLLKLGLRETWARVVGWLTYVTLLAVVIVFGPLEPSTVADSLWAVLAAAIAFAIFWDVRRSRMAEARQASKGR
ncbi:MAG: hypothetical protein ACE5HJ_09415 [Thermoplasmata archaeon]